jgi:hypothetical protein
MGAIRILKHFSIIKESINNIEQEKDRKAQPSHNKR